MYIGDEPYQTNWDGTWTPALYDSAAAENKKRWHTCLTFGRVTPSFLRDGWDGNGPPAKYRYLDYAWLQYNASYRKKGVAIQKAIDSEKVVAGRLNVGLALSMNMVNAGLRTNLGGVTACWDNDTIPGTATGVVIGSPADAGYQEGEKIPCSSLPPTAQPHGQPSTDRFAGQQSER